MHVPDSYYLMLSIALFVLGGAGVLMRRDLLAVFMGLQLMFMAVGLGLAVCIRWHGVPEAQFQALMVGTVTAVELLVGLALLAARYRGKGWA